MLLQVALRPEGSRAPTALVVFDPIVHGAHMIPQDVREPELPLALFALEVFDPQVLRVNMFYLICFLLVRNPSLLTVVIFVFVHLRVCVRTQ